MALGGGQFLTQNKTLPGAYINMISSSKASATLGDRGIVAMGLELDWGPDDQVFTVESSDFISDTLKIFGYSYTSDKMKGLRDLFLNATKCYFYKLTTGTKASNDFATAKYKGTRGNSIKIVISKNIDNESKFDVKTLLDDVKDTQTVTNASELINNDFVVFNKSATLTVTAGNPLTGGTTIPATGTEYQAFLNAIESYSFNILGCLSPTSSVISLYVAFTKRMLDEVGVKFQTVVYKTSSDYDGIIPVFTEVIDDGATGTEWIYWVSGAEAGCPINESLTNKTYDGEYTLNVSYKQSELEAAIKAGKFMAHKVNNTIRVLADINSFVSVTDTKGSDFSSNQTIRVLHQIANDIATIFNTKYLGKVQNDEAGRTSLWNEIVTHHKELQTIRAISNFDSEDVVVEIGNDKKSVSVSDGVLPTNAMEKLYMTVIVL